MIPSTTIQVIKNKMTDYDGVIEFKNPEKIMKPEDLQVGDFIQMPINDTLYNKNQAFIITNISPQDNHYLIQPIEKQKIQYLMNNYTWYRFDTLSSRLISFEVLIRDYPYKIGHASGPMAYCQQESYHDSEYQTDYITRCYDK
jgi:REP element-mobilizing transposase RayT